MIQRTGLAFTFLSVLLLTACTGSRAVNVVPAATLQNLGPRELVLQPGDALSVSVWPEQTLSGEFVVEESGYVYLPYLQRVRAGGVSIDDLRDQLRGGYAEMMQNPVVTITPMFRVALMGEVRQPGVYTITPAYTLFDLIGEAGGFQLGADQERIRIVRPGVVVEYDALRALESGENLDMVQLRSGDQIIVPGLEPGTNWRGVLDFLQSLSLVVVLVDRFSN